MKKSLYAGIAIIVILVLYDLSIGPGISASVFPVSRDSLCGPICPSTGPRYWEKTCRGIQLSARYITDSARAHCIGFTADEKQCFGILTEDGPTEEINCEVEGTKPSVPATQQPAQTYTPPATTQTQPSPSVTAKEYANSDYGISFSHPTSWQCKTYKTNSAHPDWHQTICDDEGVYSGDPLVAISVPFVAEDKDTWTKIRESTVAGKNSSVVTKTVYRSAGFGGSIGLVEYIFTGSASVKSYSLYALYGTSKPYATAEETEGVLDHIVQSLVVQ